MYPRALDIDPDAYSSKAEDRSVSKARLYEHFPGL